MIRNQHRQKYLAALFIFLLSFTVKADEIRIGVVSQLTGATATFGQENANGIMLAHKKLKKVGDHTLKLFVEDDKSEAIESTNATRKLLNVDKVSVMIGAPTSSLALASAPIVQEAKIPFITPTATNAKVTQMGSFISRACFTDDFQGVVMAKFALNDLKLSKGIILTEITSDYSQGLSQSFKKEFLKLGGKLVGDEDLTYSAKDTDFQSILRKVKRAKADFIFIPGYYVEVGHILKQARAQGINIPVLGGDGWDSPVLFEIAGPSATNIYISNHFASDDSNPRVQEFVKLYQTTYKSSPGSFAALGYDAYGMVVEAIKKAKSTKSEDINQALTTLKNYEGITGTISLDKNRNPIKSAVILEGANGKFKFRTRVNP